MNVKTVIGTILSLSLSGVVSGCLVGCAPAFPREFEVISKAIATSVTDQARWDNTMASVNGQVINPGLEVEAGLKYFGAARLVGVSGQVGISANGGGSGSASPEALKAIRDQLSAEGLPESVVRKIVDAVVAKFSKPYDPTTDRPVLNVTDTDHDSTTAAPNTGPAPKSEPVVGALGFGNVPTVGPKPSVSEIASLRAELLSYGIDPRTVDDVVKSLTK